MNRNGPRKKSQALHMLKRRKCLKCDKKFPSEGVHNRLCELCKKSNQLLALNVMNGDLSENYGSRKDW